MKQYFSATMIVSGIAALVIFGAILHFTSQCDVYAVDANGKPTTKTATIKRSWFGPGKADLSAAASSTSSN